MIDIEGRQNVTISEWIQLRYTEVDHHPMLVIRFELDGMVGAELTEYFPFIYGEKKPRAAAFSAMRIRSLCEAAGIGADTIPSRVVAPDDLQSLADALSNKKLVVWIRKLRRKDTGQDAAQVLFRAPDDIAQPSEPKVVALVDWVVANAQAESRLLYPDPQHYVFIEPLLDAVVEIFGVEKKDMSRLVDEANEKKPR